MILKQNILTSSRKTVLSFRSILHTCIFCVLFLFVAGGVVYADQNRMVTIDPVPDMTVGSSLTISGTSTDPDLDSLVISISPKGWIDAQKAYFEETNSSVYRLVCPENYDYCLLSRNNPDGSVLTVPYPNCPDAIIAKIPVEKGEGGISTWRYLCNGTVGDRVLQPDTYLVQVDAGDGGVLPEATFTITL
ncbi:MAG: hypothetical protein LUQ07_04695 [Methanospirillum sp.]|nr:hypothetical protein [Methanospirillum sp.]